MFRWWKITIFGALFTFLALFWIFVFGISANQPGSYFNKQHNAVWIGHEWVGEQKTMDDIEKLVFYFKKYDIDTVFVHTGPLGEDGTVDSETYKYSINFIETAKKFDDGISYQAWLGQIRNKIDLSSQNVRHNITNLCMILTQLVGFDGIHYDIEPVWDEDMDFIKLLEETRLKIPEDKKISVALAEFIPESLIWITENVYKFENYNTEINYLNVAKYADQIVVMVYDTGIKSGWMYRWFVKEQTIRVTDLIKDKEIFIAVPAYEEKKENFDPNIENVENGLLGIIKGLNNFRSNEKSFAGVAIYPFWEIEKDEWDIFENLWIQ